MVWTQEHQQLVWCDRLGEGNSVKNCCWWLTFWQPEQKQSSEWSEYCERWIIQAWQENIWVPDRKRTNDLPNTWRALYPLSYENSWRARPFNWVHMWQASCILLGSALSNSSWVVISEYCLSVHGVIRESNFNWRSSFVRGFDSTFQYKTTGNAFQNTAESFTRSKRLLAAAECLLY